MDINTATPYELQYAQDYEERIRVRKVRPARTDPTRTNAARERDRARRQARADKATLRFGMSKW